MISTTRGWFGSSRQRWDEVREVEPLGRGKEVKRCRKEVMHKGET